VTANLRIFNALTGNILSKEQAIGRYFAQILSMIPFRFGCFWIAIDKKSELTC